MPEPEAAAEIRAALEKIQSWQEMARSPQLSKFLGYIVERTLGGDIQSIKAYAIAVDVFGRPADFDPQTDPIVRVQARRLRGLLSEYYDGPGQGDAVRITLPVGRYVPEFTVDAETATVAEDPPAPVRRSSIGPFRGGPLAFVAAVLLGVGIVAMILVLTARPGPRQGVVAPNGVQPPSLTIVEFQNLLGDRSRSSLISGLAIELVSDLALFGEMSVQYGESTNAGGDSDFVLTGMARASGASVQYSAVLTEASSQSVVWSRIIERGDDNTGPVDDISRDLSLVLGSPRGPLHAPVRARIAAGEDFTGARSLYLCLMMFHYYRDMGGHSAAQAAEDCFTALPETVRQRPAALAALGSLMAETAPTEALAERLAAADSMLTSAIGEGALNSFVWEQRARLYELQNLPEQARGAYGSALQLNPANADALAAFALMLALRGELDRAAMLGNVVITDTPEPRPDWYYGAPAIVAFRQGDFAAAVDYASRYARADKDLGPVLAVLAGLGNGEGDVVSRFLPQVLDSRRFRHAGILPQVRERVSDGVLIADIRKGLMEAGVPSAALNGAY